MCYSVVDFRGIVRWIIFSFGRNFKLYIIIFGMCVCVDRGWGWGSKENSRFN